MHLKPGEKGLGDGNTMIWHRARCKVTEWSGTLSHSWGGMLRMTTDCFIVLILFACRLLANYSCTCNLLCALIRVSPRVQNLLGSQVAYQNI